MSLDQNLFTLNIGPNRDDPNVIDLVDNSLNSICHYRKQRVSGPVYKIEVYDPHSESLLITATAPNATSKTKVLELCNPTQVVELKYTGTITFRWSFKWEEHEFEWKREECYMIRKPDPPVLVAVTKVTPGRLKTSSVQILDYNLNRFDVEDRKGLEIVLLTALLTFQDSNETYHGLKDESVPATPATLTAQPTFPFGKSVKEVANVAPPPPPKPPSKTGIDRVAELQAARGDYNEITVEDECSFEDYASYCANLLEDDAMLFITIHSQSAEQVPKVLQVVEQTKRLRHKAGLTEEQELHQYVLYDTRSSGSEQKGPRRINLDDPANKLKGKAAAYTPPSSLSVHLSKIPMPELQPKPSIHHERVPSKDVKLSKKEEKEKREREKKEAKRTKKQGSGSGTSPAPTPPSSPPQVNQSTKPSNVESNKLSRPKPGPIQWPGVPPAHLTHPNQPAPSPSQLNNPGIYVAPPPPRPNYGPQYGPSNGPNFPAPQVPFFHANQGPAPSLYGPHVPPFPGPPPQSGPPLARPPPGPPPGAPPHHVGGFLGPGAGAGRGWGGGGAPPPQQRPMSGMFDRFFG